MKTHATVTTYTLLAAVLLLFASGCLSDKGPIIIEEEFDPQDTTVVLSYQARIQPFFDAKCIGCHHESHAMLDLRAGVSYNELMVSGENAPYLTPGDGANSPLYQHLTGELQIMPPWGDTTTFKERITVFTWIELGAENN